MNDITSPSRRTLEEQKGQNKSHQQLLLMQQSLRSEMLNLKTVYTHRQVDPDSLQLWKLF